MPQRKAPHCASAWHFQPCTCGHERQLHLDEKTLCKERDCGCIYFERPPNYPLIEHITIPVKGEKYEG